MPEFNENSFEIRDGATPLYGKSVVIRDGNGQAISVFNGPYTHDFLDSFVEMLQSKFQEENPEKDVTGWTWKEVSKTYSSYNLMMEGGIEIKYRRPPEIELTRVGGERLVIRPDRILFYGECQESATVVRPFPDKKTPYIDVGDPINPRRYYLEESWETLKEKIGANIV